MTPWTSPGCRPLSLLAAVAALALQPGWVLGQAHREVGREAALQLRFDEIEFDPPEVQERSLSSGVTVFFMEDHTLPLVTVYARFRGGYALLPRRLYAAASALSGLLRSGGTANLSPDSVDFLLDFYALQTSFGSGGQSTFSSLNTLTRHLDPGLRLWTDLLRNPRFDSLEVEVWRDRQLDGTRRRADAPGLLAVSQFNRIMFGDHPVGWEFDENDLSPERVNPRAMMEVHSRILCPENLILGVVGAVSWDEMAPRLEEVVAGWPSCTQPLLEAEAPEFRRGRSVFLIPRKLTQSTIVMAKPGGITQSADGDYFASRIGNSILGASGFTSRLLSRVRTDMGLAYGVSSFWTTPARYEGIVGATTQTKTESTVEATRLILRIMEEMTELPPEQAEVDRIVSQIVNSFVFNFQDPSQIVSRQMFYQAQELPEDWLERYVDGIQRVTPQAVQRVFRRYVDPQDMLILVVGDPEGFDEPLEVLGDVYVWDPIRGEVVTGGPGGERRSPR
jgi:zinc protease